MAHITTETSVDDVLNTWFNKKFVEDLEFELQHQKFAAEAMVPEGLGNIARYIEFAPPARNVSYSGLGNTLVAQGLSVTATAAQLHEITGITMNPTNVTVVEYGEHVKVGSLFDFAAMPGTRQQTIKRLTDGAKVSLDDLVRFQANITTVGYSANTSEGGIAVLNVITTTGVQARLGAAAIMTLRGTLRAGLVQGIKGVAGHPDRHYAAILTPTQETQITTEVTTGRLYWSSAVVNVPGTEGQLKWVNGYIGSIYGTAVYITQNFTQATFTTTASHDVGFIMGADAVAAVAFRQMKPRIVLNEVNSPFKNLNSIAWHAQFGAGLIGTLGAGQNRVIKIYSLA